MVAIVKKTVAEPTKVIHKDIMKDRVETDKRWFYLFVVIYVIWLGSCSYLRYIKDDLEPIRTRGCSLFLRNDTYDQEDFITNSIFNLARLAEHTKEHGRSVLYINTALYYLIVDFGILALFLRVYHKYCIHCMLICLGMQSISLIYRTAMYYNYDSMRSIIPWEDKFLYWIIPDLAAFLVCIFLIFVVSVRKGKDAVVDAYRKTMRFYSFHLNTIVFGFFILLMMASLICFTLGMIKGVGSKNITLALPIAILIGSSYLVLLMYYFGVAVMSLATANSYWTQTGKSVSFTDVSRAVITICRYHFGTICFNATGILPLTVALIALLKSLCQTIRSRSGFSRKYIMVAFFFFVSEYSTMITATTGRNFHGAIDRFIHLPIEARRAARNLRQSQMIWMIIGLIMIATNNLLIIGKWLLDEDDPHFTQAAIFSYASIIYLYMPIALAVDVVMDTILLCDIEKNEAMNNIPMKEVAVDLTVDVPVDD